MDQPEETPPEKIGKWWVRGGTGWVGFVEAMHAGGVSFDAETMDRLREVRDRLNEIITGQEKRSESHASSFDE